MSFLPLALFGTLGPAELLVIFAILLLIFGATKLPQLGSALGKTIRGFKEEMRQEAEAPPKAPPAENAFGFCPKCGAPRPDAEAAFCPKCGQKLA